jgi:hypothetical protein
MTDNRRPKAKQPQTKERLKKRKANEKERKERK